MIYFRENSIEPNSSFSDFSHSPNSLNSMNRENPNVLRFLSIECAEGVFITDIKNIYFCSHGHLYPFQKISELYTLLVNTQQILTKKKLPKKKLAKLPLIEFFAKSGCCQWWNQRLVTTSPAAKRVVTSESRSDDIWAICWMLGLTSCYNIACCLIFFYDPYIHTLLNFL